MPRPVPPFVAALAAALLLLGLPATASAYPPSTFASYAGSSGATTAVLDGTVVPGYDDTSYYAEYDLESSTWCSSGGQSGSPAYTTPTTDLGFQDNGAHDVSIPLSGLTEDVEYCIALVASNIEGDYTSGQRSWWQGEPDVTTTGVSMTGFSTATVAGQINPHHQVTFYYVGWGDSSSTWCQSSGATGSPPNISDGQLIQPGDATVHDITRSVGNLNPGATYCAALITSSGSGEHATGAQLTWTQSWPLAQTWDAYSTSPTEAVVEGQVNPAGDATTTYEVQYALASSQWCTSGGASGSPDDTTTGSAAGLDLTSASAQYVAAGVTGLTEELDYCGRLVATNDTGESDGQQVWWTQGLPTTDTYTENSTGTTTATVTGDVDPAGQATTYQVDYDAGDSNWCQTGIGTPTYSTTATSVAGIDGNTFYPVTVDLTGLTPGAYYCADVVATNAAGTYESFPVYWSQPTPPPPPPALYVSVSGSGTVTSSPAGIDCGGGATACSYAFPFGTKVALTATPATGGSFSLWTYAPGCTAPHVTTCTVTYGGGAQTIGAVFTNVVPNPVSVSVVVAGNGSGTVMSDPAGIACGLTCSYTFPAGSEVTLSATPAAGSTFTGWTGAPCYSTGICTVGQSGTVTATFVETTPPPVGCRVPKVTGDSLARAKSAIKRAHCAVGKVTRAYSKVKKGRVAVERPGEGTSLAAGAKVSLVVSKGPKPKKKR